MKKEPLAFGDWPVLDPIPGAEHGPSLDYRRSGDRVHLIAPPVGIRCSPPALRLVALSILFLTVGAFIIVGAAIGSFRKLEWMSIVSFLIGGGVGAGVLALGIAAWRWATSAALARTEVVLSQETLKIRRSHPPEEISLSPLQIRSIMVTDQFKLAFELLIITCDSRVIRVLNGRTQAELQWIAGLLRLHTCSVGRAPEELSEVDSADGHTPAH